MKDPQGANLDCIQIVKGGLDVSSKAQKKGYDVQWSNDWKKESNGKLKAVGITVDLKTAKYTNGAVPKHMVGF